MPRFSCGRAQAITLALTTPCAFAQFCFLHLGKPPFIVLPLHFRSSLPCMYFRSSPNLCFWDFGKLPFTVLPLHFRSWLLHVLQVVAEALLLGLCKATVHGASTALSFLVALHLLQVVAEALLLGLCKATCHGASTALSFLVALHVLQVVAEALLLGICKATCHGASIALSFLVALHVLQVVAEALVFGLWKATFHGASTALSFQVLRVVAETLLLGQPKASVGSYVLLSLPLSSLTHHFLVCMSVVLQNSSSRTSAELETE